mmetsp:Transcript_10514/g.47379  ORF Transcript_10514/g.47379 Transcript_10514/m.47379 type:complete len:242 (-) Transcript_10514:1577-2302(-)
MAETAHRRRHLPRPVRVRRRVRDSPRHRARRLRRGAVRAALGARGAVPEQENTQHLRPASVQRLLRDGVRVPRRVPLPTEAMGVRVCRLLVGNVGEDERALDGAPRAGAPRGRRTAQRRVCRGRRGRSRAAGGRLRVPIRPPGFLRPEGFRVLEGVHPPLVRQLQVRSKRNLRLAGVRGGVAGVPPHRVAGVGAQAVAQARRRVLSPLHRRLFRARRVRRPRESPSRRVRPRARGSRALRG